MSQSIRHHETLLTDQQRQIIQLEEEDRTLRELIRRMATVDDFRRLEQKIDQEHSTLMQAIMGIGKAG